MKHNRDWKTFNTRWSGYSRFEKFLIWSVVAHFVAAWLITIPLLTAYQEKEILDKQREELVKAEEKKVEKLKAEVKKEAEKEVQSILKEEIAEEQIRPLFNDLTKDFLTMELAEAYWDDLMFDLQEEFEDLADFFESEAFDLVGAEMKIQELKEKTVERLQEFAARKQSRDIEGDVQAAVERTAKQLAEHFKNELTKNVALPVAADFEKKIAEEKQKAIAALHKAEQELQQAAEPARKVAKNFKDMEKKFGELDQQQAAANAKKDKQAAADVGKQVKDQRATMIGTGVDIRKLPAKLKAAGKALEGVYPQAADEIKKIEAAADAAGKNRAEALKLSGEGKLTETTAKAKAGKNEASKVADGIAKVQAAIKLQLAALQADDLKGETGQLAKQSGVQAKEKNAAEAGKDDKGQDAVAKKIADGEKTAGNVADKASVLARLIADTEKNLPGAKSPDGKEKDNGLQTAADKIAAQLKQGKDLLGKQAPKDAAAKFADAGKEIGDLQKAIQAAQEKLGLPGEDVGKALTAKLQKFAEKELAGKVDAKFGKAVNDVTIPGIVQKLMPVLEKGVPGQGDKAAQTRNEILNKVEKALQKYLVEDVKPGQVFAKSTTAKLPEAVPGARDSANPYVKEAADKAQKSAEGAIDRGINATIASGTRLPALAELAKAAGSADAKQADLLAKLARSKGLIDAKRKDFLGQVDGVGVAAARQRYQSRKASVGRGVGMTTDMKTVEKLRDIIKDRGRITGELFGLRGAEGELAKLEEDHSISPNLVAVSQLPEPETPAKEPVERKVKTPDFAAIRFGGIPFLAADAIKIDGELGDWKDVPRIQLEPVKLSSGGAPIKVSPEYQTGYVAFTPEGMLVAVDIIDTSGAIETKYWKRGDKDGQPVWDGPFWQNDGIEIYLDTLNTKDRTRGELNTHQFFVFPFACEDEENGGYESYMHNKEWLRVPYSKDVIRKAGKKTELGWSLEVLIPKSIIRRGELSPGRVVGFNLQIDTGTSLFYFWTRSKASTHPDTWGDIQFLGSDGKIEILDGKKDEVVKSLVPGQPVRIRVTDPDMNLNAEKKDKVSVTLRTLSGDSETILLEETDIKSGVFVGGLPTRLDIGVRQPGLAELLEGETVSVEYIDQARAFGERNQPIRAAFAVSSIGSKLEP